MMGEIFVLLMDRIGFYGGANLAFPICSLDR